MVEVNKARFVTAGVKKKKKKNRTNIVCYVKPPPGVAVSPDSLAVSAVPFVYEECVRLLQDPMADRAAQSL